MRDAIKNLNRQFAFKPKIENPSKLKKAKKFLVCGMGGSRLPATLLKLWNPSLDIIIWNDYGLPAAQDLKERLVIISSYSGNTEEAVSSFEEAKQKKLSRAVIAAGGKLIEIAKKDHAPYVRIPNTGIQPRSGLGFMLRALMKMIGDEKGLRESAKLEQSLDPSAIEASGRRLAAVLKGAVPVIYSSRANEAIAYNWKIKFNETGKVPAFMNIFPELNHNEMTGFDVIPSTRALSKQFHFIFLEDLADHPQIQLRMRITRDLYRVRGLKASAAPIEGESSFVKMFSSLVLADWTAFHLAMNYGAEAEKVPMVEDLKVRLK